MNINFKEALKNWWNDLLGRKEYKRYREKDLRWNRVIAQFLWVLALLLNYTYIVWLFFNTNWKIWFVSVPFLLAEIAYSFALIIWGIMLWAKRHHKPAGIEQKTPFSVDIFICTCKEPFDIISQTIAAAAQIKYENKKIYILDDGNEANIKTLAQKYGCHYFSRPVHNYAKAGNLNYGLTKSNGDLILILDADQVAEPDIIQHIIGYFEIPRIGFVQTQQHYSVPQNDPWGNEDIVFYKAAQAGKDSVNAAISCGSGVMYRRQAIESIGGFSIWNVVEDVHTSMLLHNKGWISVYHDMPYTTGTAPQDILSHTKQRWQWAVDSTRMLFYDNPFKYKGLNLFQKIQYFHFGYNYIATGVFLPIFFLIPIYGLFTQNFILLAPITTFLCMRIPYLIVHMICNRLLTEWTYNFKVFQAQAGLFAVFFSALIQVLLHPSSIPKYTVTSKRTQKVSLWLRLRMTWPHLLIVITTFAAMIYGALTIQNNFWFLALNIFWGLWTILSLSRFLILGLVPQLYQSSKACTSESVVH